MDYITNENNRRAAVEEFNKRSLSDLERNYFVNLDEVTDEVYAKKHALAKQIRDSIDTCSLQDLQTMYAQCATEKEYKQKLLAFELKYYKHSPRSMSINEFKDAAYAVFNRYQSKGGGNLIEDMDWDVFTVENDTTGKVKSNEILFENSVPRCDADEDNTMRYLRHIVKQLRSLSDDYKIELRFRDDHDITWIWIWCVNKTMDSGVPEIGL